MRGHQVTHAPGLFNGGETPPSGGEFGLGGVTFHAEKRPALAAGLCAVERCIGTREKPLEFEAELRRHRDPDAHRNRQVQILQATSL